MNSTPGGLSHTWGSESQEGVAGAERSVFVQSLEGGKEPLWGLPGFPAVRNQGEEKRPIKASWSVQGLQVPLSSWMENNE